MLAICTSEMAKKRNKNNEKRKINLVFDEVKRKDFLCGFRKRKLERKKKAQEEMQRMLKEEKRRIKLENKESYKKLVVSSRPIPDIEQLLKEEYEDENVNVKILELSSDTLQKKDIIIGENRPKVIEGQKEKSLTVSDINEVPGMSSHEQTEDVNSDIEEDKELKSKKDVKKLLKKQATKKLQKSKVFQMKSKLDRIQNKKSQKQKFKNDQKKDKSRKKNHRKKH